MVNRMAPARSSDARDRILATADRLFYAEGLHAVGVDRIIAEAAVAKATFYRHFPSKDALIVAYLRRQSAEQRAVSATLPVGPSASRVQAVFASVVQLAGSPDYHGCPFVNAAAEFPDSQHPVRLAVREHRDWFRNLLQDALAPEGSGQALGRVVDTLIQLKDGLLVGGDLDQTYSAAQVEAAVSAVLDADGLASRR